MDACRDASAEKSSFLVSLGLVSLFAGSVLAAHLSVKTAPPYALYNWTNFYGGAHMLVSRLSNPSNQSLRLIRRSPACCGRRGACYSLRSARSGQLPRLKHLSCWAE